MSGDLWTGLSHPRTVGIKEILAMRNHGQVTSDGLCIEAYDRAG